MSSVAKDVFGKNAGMDPDLTEFGVDLFDGEELADAAYSAFLSMIAKRATQANDGNQHISDVGALFLHGAYMPCTKRLAYMDTSDVAVESIPRKFSFMYDDKEGDHRFIGVRRVGKFPRGVIRMAKGAGLKLIYVRNNKGELAAETNYVTVKNGGDIRAATYEGILSGYTNTASHFAAVTALAASTICELDDARHLWSAEVEEEVVGSMSTVLSLGLGAEQIKSCLYARSLPVTETGRKRPILHLVRAHQRRMREGTDIDISRHIRGVDDIEMAGMTFRLRPPVVSVDLWGRWANG